MFIEEWDMHKPQHNIHLQFYSDNKSNKWTEEKQRREQWEGVNNKIKHVRWGVCQQGKAIPCHSHNYVHF